MIVGVNVMAIGEDGQFLLGLRHGTSIAPGTWGTPGGHIEKGETPCEGAIRELREETGLILMDPRSLGYVSGVFADTKKQYLSFLVVGRYQGEAKAKEPERCKEWKVFTLSQLPEPLFPPLQRCLSELPDIAEALSPPDFKFQR